MAKSLGKLSVAQSIFAILIPLIFLTAKLPAQDVMPTEEKKVEKKTQKKSKSNSKTVHDYSKPSGLGLDIYGNLLLGSSQSSGAAIDGEPKKSGTHLGLEVVASVFRDNFGIDSGIGWFSNSMKPASGPTQTTSLPLLTLAPMLRLTDLFFVGPTAQVAFGSFKTQNENKYKKAQTMFVGGKVKISYASEKFVYNGALEYLTEINDEGQDIQLLLLNLGFGIPVVKRYTLLTKQKTVEQQRTLVKETIKKEVQTQTIKQTVALVFDSQVINFVTAKSDLSFQSAVKLGKLGQFLAKNGGLWTSLGIEGHTDKRGSLEYNLKLSTERANAVLNVLVANGVVATKLSAEGMAYNQPIDAGDSELSLARNRRVEFKFDGVTDEAKLRAGIDESMR